MTIREQVARTLRLSDRAAAAVNEQIDQLETVARQELSRAGVPAPAAASMLVDHAVATYIAMEMGDRADYERMQTSWLYQLDNLRKSALEVDDV